MKEALPARPSLEQLKKQAKDLLNSHRAGSAPALARVRQHLPAQRGQSPEQIRRARLALHDAQSVIAREYGFPSWAALHAEVGRRTLDFDERAEKFVRAATSELPRPARLLLAGTPALASANIYTAAVLGDLPALQHAVGAKPDLAKETGGPRGKDWTLLHYVAFSVLQKESDEAKSRFAACAKFLLENGADPNAAWFSAPPWQEAPLRALYGACGVNNNAALARVLLAAGAQLNDGESLPHAAEHFHRECLEVLLEHGENVSMCYPRWNNTPLFFISGHVPNSEKWPVVAKGIHWLLEHGADPNVPCYDHQETALHCAVRQRHPLATLKCFLAHGANPSQPAKNGRTPYQLALITGYNEAADLFREHGAPEPQLSAKEKFLAACFSGRTKDALALRQAHPKLFAAFDEQEKLSLVQAARSANVGAVEAFVAAGFDLAYQGAQEWGATPLHQAAWHGYADVVRILLAHDAPVEIQANPPVKGSPLNWAAHGSKNCANPRGDYAAIVRALLAAGAQINPEQIQMATPEVAAILQKHEEKKR